MEPAAALLVWALLPLALRAESGAWEPRAKVPQPTNVTIESYNFNTSVRWDYKSISSEPFFVVELRCYLLNGNYTNVRNCVNISQRYCDLTHKVEHCLKFWVRVKALGGPQESEYTESQEFIISRTGRIGPPKLNLSILDHEVRVDIEHPLTPYRKKHPITVRTNFTDFVYIVSFWEKGSQEKRLKFKAENCSRKRCTIDLYIPFWNTSYCVSAYGISEIYNVKGEESKESCIDLSPKHQSDLTMPIILGVLSLVVLVVILGVLFVCMKKKNIKLPKSLAAVVRSQVNSFDTNSEPKNISFITSSSYKQVLPECEDEKSPEQVDFIEEVKNTDCRNSGKEVGPHDSQGTLGKTEEMSIQEGIIVEIPEGEQHSEDNDNYFKSISDQEEMDNNLADVDFPKAVLHRPTDCRNISGYDKPHWKEVSVVDSLVT